MIVPYCLPMWYAGSGYKYVSMDGLPSLGPGTHTSAGALRCGAEARGGGWVGAEGGPDAETESDEPER